jgi:hypothetical protein
MLLSEGGREGGREGGFGEKVKLVKKGRTLRFKGCFLRAGGREGGRNGGMDERI